VLLNTKVQHKDRLMKDERVLAKVHEAEEFLNGTGRVLVRPSGTEPLIRVMVEGPDQQKLKELAQGVIDIINQCDE